MTNSPPKTPAKPAKRARSGSKARESTRPAPGKPYDAELKARALEQLAGEGMAATHASTGVAKATLHRWAKAAGIDLGSQARARTATATEHVRARAAEVTLGTVALLEQHVAQAGDLLSTVAGVNALAARMLAGMDPDKLERYSTIAGDKVRVTDPDVDEVLRVAEAIGSLPLATRDAEGILTRAIHDLQLLKGEATERGELVVEFAVPRPVAIDPDDVPTYSTTED